MGKKKDGEYWVDRVPQVDEQIGGLEARANTPQKRQELINALKKVVHELGTRPLEWGDPERRTRKAGGLICHGIVSPLVVHYAVFEAERVVIILKIKPLPGSSFE